jgi:hypothetical protein
MTVSIAMMLDLLSLFSCNGIRIRFSLGSEDAGAFGNIREDRIDRSVQVIRGFAETVR